MEVGNKRNRDAEDDAPDDLDEQADNGLRRRLISVICGLLTVTHIFMGTKSIETVHKCCAPLLELDMRGICNEDGDVEAIFLPVMHFPRDLWARILATDMYCVDSTRKSEQPSGILAVDARKTGTKNTECHRLPSLSSQEIVSPFYILVLRIRYSLPVFVIYGAKSSQH